MKTSIPVQNLNCGGCAHTISSNISSIEHRSNIYVDVETSSVSFEHKDDVNAVLVKARLKSIGYPSIENDNTLSSKAKSFVTCATGKFHSKNSQT
ncbi:heavy-metal-associated domain-containing protein [Subsaximicrobium wynnwilliamsii]|uniref:Heavy-metal-associated domain-containing protein n=1 Tax=Subsaximicrobium wynnwilliamsii TaxID=291179 RepID=A0A5C6ZJH0_9FLAO|nr:heavy metal-associated domain-containing protein [Subsaximicrobium wynnwilliamsii]TXD84415.1 heavy-metal-associated domain-containing protein [Subsaximicrobium wynnwilliamsii]TXD90096.1 heavy-metal-associated domain-containing protein [Subsaximicrobium wynnwilliamsii]TXE04148.1 heavy-metal-associated domain-containing protein [Subsaximicrobium wynnwilliamsii]